MLTRAAVFCYSAGGVSSEAVVRGTYLRKGIRRRQVIIGALRY